MGDSYGRIMENQDHYGIIQRTSIYADFTHMIKPKAWLKDKYIYVVRPAEDSKESQWSDALKQIENRMSKMVSQSDLQQIREKQDKQFTAMEDTKAGIERNLEDVKA